MSRRKRKVAELGDHALSAAVGDVVSRTMSAAVGRYDAHAGADDQVERLGTLLLMVHSAVDEAERVHIAGWWLRCWLWRLRDAALDGDEVLRLFRQRRADELAAETGRGTLWNAARRVARSARSLLGDGDGVHRLSRTVARLEKLCAGLGDFLKLLELEIARSLRAPPPSGPAAEARGDPAESGILSQPDYTSLDDRSPSSTCPAFRTTRTRHFASGVHGLHGNHHRPADRDPAEAPPASDDGQAEKYTSNCWWRRRRHSDR